MNPFQSFPFFYGMRIPHLALLMKCATKAHYQAGDILFRKGDPADRVFLIRSGSVALETDNPDATGGTKMAPSGNILGQTWLATADTWRVSARASEPTTVTILSCAGLLACAEANPDFGGELMKREARRGEDFQTSAEGLVLDPVGPMARWVPHFNAANKTGNCGIPPHDTFEIAETGGKHLSLRDGEWVQLTARPGTTVFPARVKHETKDPAFIPREFAQ